MTKSTVTQSSEGIDPHLAGHYVLAACEAAACRNVRPLKFLKLVYIAHGYHLAIWDGPLLNVPAEAWKYGPVIRDLYFAVRHFGGREIPWGLLAGYVPKEEPDNSSYKEVIAEVIKAYGEYDGLMLSAATHQKGTPWSITRDRYGPDAPIDNELLKNYYKKLLA
ncbi:MAG: DUF4065 domain-containing protein [Betaproteobacteria bacterium]|nr:DUF4065 domain-containing protein [Betaproteobacteria bacterium]